MGDVSEESLLDYIFRAGGRVKNADLLKTYKHFISHNDQQLRAKYREEFKLVIDRIAVVKSENGEKYLVLKKKYKQLMQEREAGGATDSKAGPPSLVVTAPREVGEAPSRPQGSGSSEDLRPHARGPAGRPEVAKAASVYHQGPTITITGCPDSDSPEEGQRTEEVEGQLSPAGPEEILESEPEELPEDTAIPTDGEDQADGDTGSKSDLEQEEEGTGSIGSNSVALDPLEKEWMHSAACGRLAHLSQLLKQEPSLAYKKDFTSFTALHWAAKHGKGDMAAMMANAGADVNTKAHGYTPLHIAALHGHRHIVDLLIGTYGARENVRDYSGHLACHYLGTREDRGAYPGLEFQVAQSTERRNRKLAALFHHKGSGGSRKKWGSVEDLGAGAEERATPHQLALPAFRPRKFSR
ncbi:ankyrin repeat domain-containing protein SOWAHB [Anguilla anguilla]|uniref:ankyrin repeat domain-containing protein SOWAHB n=1 Tax=Anguilla anguilla TaxID=7936 RepID=UPI0015AC7A97|nr:ankyrin repeat domain-containing protein SOWAHB [Anguilla anguilla]